MFRAGLLSCLLLIAVSQAIWAQDVEPKKAPAPAPKAPAQKAAAPNAPAPLKLTPSMRRTLHGHRRQIARMMRGGPDDYYVVLLGEAIDRPREPNLLDLLQGAATFVALTWDIAMSPVVFTTGADELEITPILPPMRSNIERTYHHESRVVLSRAAAIQAVFDHTTELALLPPQPNERRYRAWAFVGIAKTEEAAQKMQVNADAKMTAVMDKPKGLLERVHNFLDDTNKAPAPQGQPKQPPAKQAPPANERIRQALQQNAGNPEGLEKLREQVQRELFRGDADPVK